jgi:hypothetical protein
MVVGVTKAYRPPYDDFSTATRRKRSDQPEKCSVVGVLPSSHGSRRVEQALEYLQGDSIVMKTKKQAAEIADYWERAGKWLDTAASGSHITNGSKYGDRGGRSLRSVCEVHECVELRGGVLGD